MLRFWSSLVESESASKGSFTNPQISLNTKAAINSLTQTLLAKQKEELINQGTNILSDLISGGNKPKDSTSSGINKPTNNSTQQATEVVTDILEGLFGKKKKKNEIMK